VLRICLNSTRDGPAVIVSLVQTQELQTATADGQTVLSRAQYYWRLGLLLALTLSLYWSTIARLIAQWWSDPNFSHGFFVPLFTAFVIWQERDHLKRITPAASWSGLAFIAVAMCVLLTGQLGAELFLARFSLLILLAGLIVLFLGWNAFRAVLFPWAFLLLMIPIPAIIFNQITFPLQLQASKLAALALPLFRVPILREGNVISLPYMQLEVAEACSGIRSLMSLATLAVIYGYLAERRIWVRCLLAIASIPIAIIANSVRIIGTGLLVQYWDPDKAEGYFHASWGWIIFVISLLLLYALHSAIRAIWREQPPATKAAEPASNADDARIKKTFVASTSRLAASALLIAGTAAFLYLHSSAETFPPRATLDSFPQQLGTWEGSDVAIDKDVLAVLDPTDYLSRAYQNAQQPDQYASLFIAYFASQRTGKEVHSPKNCLPGAGWSPLESRRIHISVPGHAPFPANRYVVGKGDSRALVLYWYWAHDRGVASEYWSKYYLVADSIRMNRSDGSIVRLTTALRPGESIESASQRLVGLVAYIVPRLDDYIPR